ncbi:MAG: ATP-binding protein [Gemmataceae bacterium]
MNSLSAYYHSWPGYAVGVILLLIPVPLAAFFPGQACCLALGFGLAGAAWLGLHGWLIHREVQRNLRECRLQEAKLEALVDSAADAILTCDAQGIIRSANLSAQRLFGYPREELIGSSVLQLIPTEMLHAVNTNQHRVLGVVTAYQGKRRDGSTFPITLALSKIRLTDSPLYSIIIHDQTTLAQARDQAEAANRAKSAFLLAASHELRTPLVAIMGTTELLGQTMLSAEQQRLWQTLSHSSEHLFCLVQQILDYSEIEMGQMRLKREVFHLGSIVQQLEAKFAPLARAKGLEFRVSHTVESSFPPRLLGDAERLRQVLECLLRNAIQFTSTGYVSLEAHVEGQHVQLTIQDTGPGIALEDQQRIFEAFERASPHGVAASGLGLGLTLAARLIRMMGGQIHLQSQPQQGCRIRLHFAFHRPPALARPVLLAVPDAALRACLLATLSELQIEPVAVSTGRKALAEMVRCAVQGHPFELVVLDNQLPDIDTEQWLQQARACSGWEGEIVVLGDAAFVEHCPAGVIPLLREQAAQPLYQRVRERLRPVAPIE